MPTWAESDKRARRGAAARTADLIAELQAEIDVHGVWTRTRGGEVKCNPLVIEVRQQRV